jgi:ribose 5-phosphate isomerase B
MKITLGSDHRGVHAKARLVQILAQLGHTVSDEGTHDTTSIDYPDVAAQVSRKVSQGEMDRGILICGTGIGMCITANKFPHVRAATCHDEVTVDLCRRHNDVNVLCLSADALNDSRMERLVRLWLETPFEGGRHSRRVEKIGEIERAELPHKDASGNCESSGGCG